MLDDIKDEPQIIKTLAEKYLPEALPVHNIQIPTEQVSKIYIVASGSSRNAGNITRYFMEQAAQIPVIVEHASEFGERNPILSSNDVVIFVSQSGETADVSQALKIAKAKGAYTFAITNNEDSTIHKTADSAMFIHAGKEISIPATKSFMAQLVCLYMIGIYIAEKNASIPYEKIESYKQKIRQMPEKIAKLISGFSNNKENDKIAQKLSSYKSLIILGRGQNFGLAEEFALKVKETCYINTSGYPTGEFLHGHLAMLDENCPFVSIITKYDENESNYNFAVNNTVQIIKKRNPSVFIVKAKTDSFINSKLSEYDTEYINIDELDEDFSPVYSASALHLLSYKMAASMGHDVNNPRSLSKTVSE